MQRVGDILLDIVGVIDDVDAFAAEFIGDVFDAHSAHSDARADGVDAGIVAADGDFRADARIAGDGDDLNYAVMNLGNFALKKSADELRRSSGENQTGTGDVDIDFDEQSVDAVSGHVLFAGNLVAGGENAFGFLEVHDDGTRIETADGTVDDLSDFVGEFVADNLFFRLADLLQNCLLRGLGCDASEIFGRDFPADFFAELTSGMRSRAVSRRIWSLFGFSATTSRSAHARMSPDFLSIFTSSSLAG